MEQKGCPHVSKPEGATHWKKAKCFVFFVSFSVFFPRKACLVLGFLLGAIGVRRLIKLRGKRCVRACLGSPYFS